MSDIVAVLPLLALIASFLLAIGVILSDIRKILKAIAEKMGAKL